MRRTKGWQELYEAADESFERTYEELRGMLREAGLGEELVDRASEMMTAAHDCGIDAAQCGDPMEALRTLWMMRDHSGRQAWAAMVEMAEANPPTSGAEMDALILRWEREWLRVADAH